MQAERESEAVNIGTDSRFLYIFLLLSAKS